MKQLLVVIVVLAAMPAAAHEEGDRALGIVESVSGERIVVKAADGHRVPFTITKDTRFVRGDDAIRPEDVKTGERVVVHGKRVGEDLQALRVKVGAAIRKK